MEENRETKIIRHPRHLPITFVMVVFLLIAVYFFVQFLILIRSHSISAYNVGTPSSDSLEATHEGILVRSETVYRSPAEGYVNFYLLSGEWSAKEQLISSIDPNGDIQEKLRTLYYGHSTLSYASRLSVQNAIRRGVETYDPMDFSSVKRAKGEIEAAVMNALLKEGGAELKSKLSDLNYTSVVTEESGFFLNWYDGYENAVPSELSSEDFNKSGYHPTYVGSGEKVTEGQILYKLVSENKFQLCFLMTDQEVTTLALKKQLSVRMSDGLEITGNFLMDRTSDGKTMGVITFAKYGANYTNSRYQSFRIIDRSVSGFKIPESAIVEKSFFVVPKEYLATGGSTGNETGLMISENGRFRFVPCNVHVRVGTNDDRNFVIGEDVAYVYSEKLRSGQTIVKPGDEGTPSVIGRMASVEGCFQINNGYCIFKPVVRIRNSLDTSFVIVSANVRNGLKNFDRIVLDASGLKEQEIVFE
ncbi:MAG: hypothetical protein IK088_05520 [Lachnospiraceae bacterium]|nr:hypothetical protein [Lachnospiraceae bacterium]